MTPPPGTGTLSTHVLDAALGRPAAGMPVRLESRSPDAGWTWVGEGLTDADGRLAELAPAGLAPGTHRLTFDTGTYHRATGQDGFYPEVGVVFVVEEERHHHVPLLLSPYAYSTYRGS